MQIFSPTTIGTMKLKNRFIQSAVLEVMADKTGFINNSYINRYKRLAKGGVGLLITGGMFVHESGKVNSFQAGIHNDTMISGLKQVTDAVHNEGGKIAFQLVHGGALSSEDMTGKATLDPSSMTDPQIEETIVYFSQAAKRAVSSGADAIELHAAHGVLITQFLSPFFNTRGDHWGGSDKNRFRYLKRIIQELKRVLPAKFPIMVKINANDYTPEQGITPKLASIYTKWLDDLGVDAVEISCGTIQHSFMMMARGSVPVDDMLSNLSGVEQDSQREVLNSLVGQFDIEEAYNLENTKNVTKISGNMKRILVGGNRTLSSMKSVIANNDADFISIGRPLVREPGWVNRAKRGEVQALTCTSCNKCFAAVLNDQPLRCYLKK